MLNFMTCDNVSKVEIIISLFEKKHYGSWQLWSITQYIWDAAA